jgi:biotin operon repressor
MKDDASHRFQRLLQLLEEVRSEPGQSAQQLAEKFGTSKRNLFRDIKLLQESGFEIESEDGYRLSGSASGALQTLSGAGQNPWNVASAAPVAFTIKIEPTLAQALRQQPLHDSQVIEGPHLYLEANPDRVADWLMGVPGAELIEPSWMRGTLKRRAEEIAERYRR